MLAMLKQIFFIVKLMIDKSFTKKNFFFTYLFILILISFSINQYYAYIGVLPVDSFSTFNTGYDILNGQLPFKDFWTIKGPVMDILQALFFKLLGVSWFSYAVHSSVFNSIFALSTFLTLKKFNLEVRYCFFYSALASILMYPTYGIPFTDHHVAIFSMLSVYCLCIAIKFNDLKYWSIIPILLFLGFFTKQTPAAYFAILISFVSILYLFFNFEKKIIIYVFLSSVLIILFFFSLVFFYDIPIKNIIVQYFLFPMSLGETRLEWVFPLEFKRFILRYKLLYIALAIPIFFLIKNCFKNLSSFTSKDNLIFILLFGTLIIFVTHQLMTINALFIFFLIPVFSGFSHIYSNMFKHKNKFIYFFLALSLVSTIYYHQKYISKRDTLILRDVNLKNAINSSVIHEKLSNLKWITHHYPKNPQEEIEYLKETMEIIKNDSRVKMIVTDYQFISVTLSINDNSAARIWWRHHIYPAGPGKKYFSEWKNFLIDRIKSNKIEVVYTIKPLEGEENIFRDLIDRECYNEKYLNKILMVQEIYKCKDFNL